MISVLVTTRNPNDEFCEGPDMDIDCCQDIQHGHCDCWYEEYEACCQCGEMLGPVVYVNPGIPWGTWWY